MTGGKLKINAFWGGSAGGDLVAAPQAFLHQKLSHAAGSAKNQYVHPSIVSASAPCLGRSLAPCVFDNPVSLATSSVVGNLMTLG